MPRYLAGYVFASLAAIAYGTTPIMARFALEHTGPATGILGGLIAYVAATAVLSLAFLSPAIRRNVFSLNRENSRLVRHFRRHGCGRAGLLLLRRGRCAGDAGHAAAATVAAVPDAVLDVAQRPTTRCSDRWCIAGVAISVAGAMMVSIDTQIIVDALALPDPLARVLLWRV